MIKMLIIITVILLIGLSGCQEKGAVERTGERVDEIIDNIGAGDRPLKEKGAMEKVGESIDETLDTESD